MSLFQQAVLPFTILSLFIPVLLATVACWILYTRLFHPLRHIPGPFLASITRLWYVQQIRLSTWPQKNRELHARYGPLVRTAPNEVSVSDADSLRIIYGTHVDFLKADFYPAWRAQGFDPRHPDLFTNLDPVYQAARRRLVNPVYNMSSVLEAEAQMDVSVDVFVKKLEEVAASDDKQSIDLAAWLQWFAFDVIHDLFFGRPLGCLERGEDVGGVIKMLDPLVYTMTTIATLPRLYRMPYVVSAMMFPGIRKGLDEFNQMAPKANALVADREQSMQQGKEDLRGVQSGAKSKSDFLAKLLQVRAERGRKEDFDLVHIAQEACKLAMSF
jgi:hypothetical protein